LLRNKYTSSAVPHDLVNIIRVVGREIADGLDIADAEAVSALARRIEPELSPRIVADRLYGIGELKKRFGYTHSAIYGRRKHLIRKDHGRKSVILGRDLLADIDAAPHLVHSDPSTPTAPPRPRGRPRKAGGGVADMADVRGDRSA
jgi:hypothetical protein